MRFAFVIHPTSLEDVVRYEPGAVGKGQPIIEKILDWMPAYAAAHITGVRTPDGRETEGWFVAATFMPEQMLTLPDDTLLCPGHGPVTTVAEEKANNPFF